MKTNNPSLKMYRDLLYEHIKPQAASFFLLLVLVLASVVLRVFGPQLMRGFIDSALAGKAAAALVASASAYLAVALLGQGVAIGSNYLGEKVSWTASNALRGELAAHALALDMGFHNDSSPGQLIERIDGDVSELSKFFSSFALMLAANLLLLAGICFTLFLEDWRYGLAFTIYIALSVLFLSRFKDVARPFVKARRQKFTEMFGVIEEHLAGTEDLRSSGAVDYSLRQLMKHSSEIYGYSRKSGFRMFLLNGTTDLLLTGGLILAMVAGFFLHAQGALSAGTVYLFIHYLTLLDEPIWAMTRQMEAFQTIGACVERLVEFRARVSALPEARPEPAGSQKDGVLTDSPDRGKQAALEFRGLSFSYNGTDPVLSNLSFTLEAGSVLGLLGRTGSGKSTLARLVARLYDPSEGSVLLGGRDLRRLDAAELRRRVAMVTQDVQLFRSSIRDNLTFFDQSFSDQRLLEAMDQLGLLDWFSRQPDGLDTRLESGGRNLSAGEAQLLAFTRVFLRDPALVVLDEASSRLDPATETLLERAIDRLLAGRSAIVIAHRLATVSRADDILILEAGKAAEYGRRTDLAADPGSRFSALLKSGMEEVLA